MKILILKQKQNTKMFHDRKNRGFFCPCKGFHGMWHAFSVTFSYDFLLFPSHFVCFCSYPIAVCEVLDSVALMEPSQHIMFFMVFQFNIED